MRYKRWLWWTRTAMIITVLQLMGATYLVFRIVKHVSQSPTPDDCLIGKLGSAFVLVLLYFFSSD